MVQNLLFLCDAIKTAVEFEYENLLTTSKKKIEKRIFVSKGTFFCLHTNTPDVN